MWRKKPCAAACLTRAFVSTDARPLRSAPSGRRLIIFPVTHGAAIFTRGETQALVTATLGTTLDEKIVDDVLNQSKRLPAPLQLPSLLHRRSASTARCRPSRGWSRKSRTPRPQAHVPDNFPIHAALFPTSSNQTAHHQWQPFAAAHLPCSMPEYT